MRLRISVWLYLGALAIMPAQGMAAQSIYTDIDLAGCNMLVAPNPDEPGGDSSSALCPGYKGYQVLFKEGDLRQSLHYGYLKPSIVENAFESFGPFNSMNPKVEWRIGASGTPIAAIQRFFVGDAENQGQVLAISKVGQPDDRDGCVAAYVDALANPDANSLARDVADTMAASFHCGTDTPQYHGAKGPKAGDPMIYRGDPQ